MTSVELLRPGVVELRDVPVPAPGPGELLVRVDAALTCGTDVKTYRRGHPRIPLPIPMGHEFSGTVAAVGAGVAGFREGEAIACVPTAPCGACRLCRRGRENLCAQAVGRMVFGAFAEYVLLPRHLVECNVFRRPAGLSAEIAAALEPLSCVVHGADRIALGRAEHVVLLGDGPIALLFVQLARLRGAGRVLLVGRHPIRLAAAEAFGADVLRDPRPEPSGAERAEPADAAETAETARSRGTDRTPVSGRAPRAAAERVPQAVREWTGGAGADVVIECVGRPEVWEAAPALAAIGGEVLLYGGCAAGTRVGFDSYRLHYDEVDVRGAFHYGRADVRRALEHLTAGEVDIAPLITHRRPLARIADALELVLSRTAIKVAVGPGDEATATARESGSA